MQRRKGALFCQQLDVTVFPRWFGRQFFADSDVGIANAADDVESEQTSDGDSMLNPNRLVGYVTGKNEDIPKAKQLYQEGDRIFREAQKAPPRRA